VLPEPRSLVCALKHKVTLVVAKETLFRVAIVEAFNKDEFSHYVRYRTDALCIGAIPLVRVKSRVLIVRSD
jgi:hypothetical protein